MKMSRPQALLAEVSEGEEFFLTEHTPQLTSCEEGNQRAEEHQVAAEDFGQAAAGQLMPGAGHGIGAAGCD